MHRTSCQSHVSFLPVFEVKTRLRIAMILLNYTDSVTHDKSHLERAQLLLKQIPSCFELKCRAYSLPSRCYHLVGTIPPQKQTLKRARELTSSSGEGESAMLWACNFNLQLENALTTEGDFLSAFRALEIGSIIAKEAGICDIEMVFLASILHVHLMQWEDSSSVVQAVANCDEIRNSIPADKKPSYLGLHLYNELLHTFYLLHICDYKEASKHIDILDAVLKDGRHVQAVGSLLDEKTHVQPMYHQTSNMGYLLTGNFSITLELGSAPLGGEWLPRAAVFVLVDLMAALCARPKGMFKECEKRLASGMARTEDELKRLGVTATATGKPSCGHKFLKK